MEDMLIKILVCVKSSAPADAPLVINDSGAWIERGFSHTEAVPGRYDELALEQALRLKDQISGVMVDAISCGPTREIRVLRRALGMGCDNAIHILTGEEGFVPAITTAYRLSSAIRSRSYDLILTGLMSEDMNQGIVGQMTAEFLGMPCLTSCVSISVDAERRLVMVERDIEGARRQKLEMNMPALATVQACVTPPRYPSLSKILRAVSMEIETIEADPVTVHDRGEILTRLTYPTRRRSVRFLEGPSRQKASELVSILRSRAILG